MKQDKAILKVLKSQIVPSLSNGFDSRLMSKLYLAVEKKRKRVYVLTLCLISTVSLGLILMGIYLMRNYLSDNITIQIPTIQIPTLNTLTESISKYGFSIYIAFLIFILIGLDTLLRSVFKKRKEDKFKHFNL
jgi:TRAP-type C4-dicarboxylate transport system permease small subunit